MAGHNWQFLDKDERAAKGYSQACKKCLLLKKMVNLKHIYFRLSTDGIETELSEEQAVYCRKPAKEKKSISELYLADKQGIDIGLGKPIDGHIDGETKSAKSEGNSSTSKKRGRKSKSELLTRDELEADKIYTILALMQEANKPPKEKKEIIKMENTPELSSLKILLNVLKE